MLRRSVKLGGDQRCGEGRYGSLLKSVVRKRLTGDVAVLHTPEGSISQILQRGRQQRYYQLCVFMDTEAKAGEG